MEEIACPSRQRTVPAGRDRACPISSDVRSSKYLITTICLS